MLPKSNPKKLHTKEELKKLAKKYHLELVLGLESYEIYTPDGYHFTATGAQHVRVEPHRNQVEWKKEAIHELAEFILDYERHKEPLLTHCKKGCECGWDDRS
jgi:hypothetical protein